MSTVEERLASLEARVDAMTELRTLIVDMRNDITRQFAEMRADMSELRGDMNRQAAELRGDIDRRFEQASRELGELRGEMHRIDDKHDRHFTWLVGLQMTLMVAVIGVLVGAYYQ